ncbi:hypothetical protein ACJRO7_015687 [Eucalyptus globulus]|uniref:Lachrymatory-factor synthase n=1 Tax=Eucalyptus globulus TaxID=34317 RepID=A0ABD3L5L0_EUCGL
MDQMESQSCHKWEKKVSTRVAKASADQIWPLRLSDCYGIHGKNGEPGCVRYCAGFSISSEGTSDPGENRPIKWSKERLVGVDPHGRSLNYEMVDSNNGFTSYASTVRVIPGDEGGCTIEWSFTVDPVEGWVLEDLVRKYEVGLQGMGRKMEDSISVM